MRPPVFWQDLEKGAPESAPLIRFILSPLSALYAWIVARRIKNAKPYRSSATVICVGNLSLGGTGKTPLTHYLRALMRDQRYHAASLSRGYGGYLKGPLKVNVSLHTADMVGDEPILLAQSGESWIGRKRAMTAKAMEAEGVSLIIMDDGHQNPDLAKDISLVVIDSEAAFGNGFVFPKGPLREPITSGLARADAIILIGNGPLPDEISNFPGSLFRAQLIPKANYSGRRLLAFAGIGRPDKFFETLRDMGAKLVEHASFDDHYRYKPLDLDYLQTRAKKLDAELITTEKDKMRLPENFSKDILTLPVTLEFDEATIFADWINDKVSKVRL